MKLALVLLSIFVLHASPVLADDYEVSTEFSENDSSLTEDAWSPGKTCHGQPRPTHDCPSRWNPVNWSNDWTCCNGPHAKGWYCPFSDQCQ